MSRRGATSLRGILAIDKPAGMTSHDVVARIRRASGEGRVGHAGTLDPAATGLLLVLVGPYTRLEPYLSSATKSYRARIAFGAETDTDDAEGSVVRTADVPAECLTPETARNALATVLGPSLQTPPAYSAIKVAGQVAHRAARDGAPLELEPRAIEVFAADLDGVDPAAATWDVAFTVSKGTYVRALARDLGRACGSAAHLAALRRTASGSVSLDLAHGLDDAVASVADGHLADIALDPLVALGLPVVEVPAGSTRCGASLAISAPATADGDFVAVTESGALSGIYRVRTGSLVPVVVLPEVPAA